MLFGADCLSSPMGCKGFGKESFTLFFAQNRSGIRGTNFSNRMLHLYTAIPGKAYELAENGVRPDFALQNYKNIQLTGLTSYLAPNATNVRSYVGPQITLEIAPVFRLAKREMQFPPIQNVLDDTMHLVTSTTDNTCMPSVGDKFENAVVMIVSGYSSFLPLPLENPSDSVYKTKTGEELDDLLFVDLYDLVVCINGYTPDSFVLSVTGIQCKTFAFNHIAKSAIMPGKFEALLSSFLRNFSLTKSSTASNLKNVLSAASNSTAIRIDVDAAAIVEAVQAMRIFMGVLAIMCVVNALSFIVLCYMINRLERCKMNAF
jgi:hypothetical protein